MKTKTILFFAFLLIYGTITYAQDKKPLMTIGNQSITKSEFERIYKKNNNLKEPSDKKAIDEYLQLFINFKLKVIEAESLGYDTLASFKKELKGYRDQLAKPYLTATKEEESLILEAYERMKTDVEASHILVKFDPNASPEDTLKAYNKAIDIRKRLLAGEAFDKVAKETSDDQSAKTNGGYLGYFSAFNMVYAFETAAYNTPVGQISMPARSRFGYHIIKVLNKRPDIGQIKVAHIMIFARNVSKEKNDSAKKAIYGIYEKLKKGEDFAQLAKTYSEDKGSAANGGDLPWFGSGRMVHEFETAAFALKNNGDFSEPIQTAYGWHIIKRIDTKGIPAYDQAKADIKQKITRDERSVKSKDLFLTKLKKEYNFKENKDVLKPFYTLIDSSVYKGKWKSDNAASLKGILFSFDGKNFASIAFASYLAKNQPFGKMSFKAIVDKEYDKFVETSLYDYENDMLEKKYPDFKNLMEEYHDGVLLFDISDKMIWSKALKDTTGLEDYYAKNKSKYMWDKRLGITMYSTTDAAVAKKALDLLKSPSSQGITDDKIRVELCKPDTSKKCVTIEHLKISKGDIPSIDSTGWGEGVCLVPVLNGKHRVAVKGKVTEAETKALSEAKGVVISDYQTFIEEEWIKTLRGKYKIKVNEKLLSTIK
jgi:peptidyl-prolyl cis-trans isomerase SurA